MMKKTILLFVAILVATLTQAQTSTGFNFKAMLAKNGNPVANKTISVIVTLKAGTAIIWRERHSGVRTDANGIFSITMGKGTRISGAILSFDKFNWNIGNANYTVQVNADGTYRTLVNSEYFKYVPEAKIADRLRPSSYGVTISNSASTHSGFHVDESNALAAGYRLSKGTSNWYNYMKPDKSWAVANDAVDVLKISDADNSVWFRGKLKPSGLEMSSGKIQLDGTAAFNGLYFKRGTNTWRLHEGYSNGNIYLNGPNGKYFKVLRDFKLDRKLLGHNSGNADMKAYIYGGVTGVGNKVANASSDGFTVKKTSTGHYEITFSETGIGSDRYIVLVTNFSSLINSAVTKLPGKFRVYTTKTSNDSYIDAEFQFVVFKK